jgi:phytoene dehydrogenase-like protein
MSEVDSSWDVIVVGSGLGGLSVAARLVAEDVEGGAPA